jgi:homocysteine S-methyltransferase
VECRDRAAHGQGSTDGQISFTLETNGKLASGETLRSAIGRSDETTGGAPANHAIDCSHPSHFEDVVSSGETWAGYMRGLRANASCKCHAELDEAVKLDGGDPAHLAERHHGFAKASEAVGA